MDYLLVGIGSAIGGILRWELSYRLNDSFPWGTFLVNCLGSFFAGLIAALVIHKFPNETMRLFMLIGFCGGFTTFSSFSVEALNLMREGLVAYALLYVIGSLLTCIGLAWVGYTLADKALPF
jgi:CrcB protein